MIRPIVRDAMFLRLKSEPATRQDVSVGQDLRDTLNAHRETCAGMAANMIGVRKRVVIANAGLGDLVLYNPVLLDRRDPYEAEEGCLSLDGVRRATRYREIELEYRDAGWNKRRQRFSGWFAQILQHELDHLDGVLI